MQTLDQKEQMGVVSGVEVEIYWDDGVTQVQKVLKVVHILVDDERN